MSTGNTPSHPPAGGATSSDSTPASSQSAPSHADERDWNKGTDAFVYDVAKCAWHDGLTANSIARRLLNSSTAQDLMRVKRALQSALKQGLLRLAPPPALQVHSDLDLLVNGTKAKGDASRIRLHVVHDGRRVEGAPVYATAAGLISEFIVAELRDSKSTGSKRKIVICNAGGRTVSETVRALARNPPIVDEFEDQEFPPKESLLFVAGNAACEPTQFHQSGNFLSVTMAEMFGAQHLALPAVDDQHLIEQHAQEVSKASLFVCGVGTCRGETHQSLLAKYFDERDWKMPGAAVGDLAFNLLDRDGRELDFAPEECRRFMRQLNPTLNLSTIMDIAHRKRVLVVLDAMNPAEKAEIGMAVLKRRYATDVVVGTRLGAEIIRAWKPGT